MHIYTYINIIVFAQEKHFGFLRGKKVKLTDMLSETVIEKDGGILLGPPLSYLSLSLPPSLQLSLPAPLFVVCCPGLSLKRTAALC